MWKQYSGSFVRKAIITAIAALAVASAVPLISFAHASWGDARYELKAESIRKEIRGIDSALFEISQEISFSESPRDTAKWAARRNYYLNLKEALHEQLEAEKDN